MLSSLGVTLAARLMGIADENKVMCSASVYHATQGAVLYQFENESRTKEIPVKGIPMPQRVYIPTTHTPELQFTEGLKNSSDNTSDENASLARANMADIRRGVRDNIDDVVDRLAGETRTDSSDDFSVGSLGPGIVAVAGDPGMDKSTVLRYAHIKCAAHQNIVTVVIKRSSEDVDDPMYVGRALLTTLVKHLGGVF